MPHSKRISDPSSQYGLPAVNPQDAGISEEHLARIRPLMQSYVEKRQVPGLLTAIARYGKLVHFETQGYADIEKGIPLKPDAIFRIYSLTKPVTAVAAMVACEEGLFLLDDPISDYLPEFAAMKVWTQDGLVDCDTPITIRHLLTHTAGFAYSNLISPVAEYYANIGLHGVLDRISEESLEDHVKRLATLPLVARPGTVWNYGESMGVLGRLLEVVSSVSFRHFLKAKVLEPLKMIDTDFFVPQEKADRLVTLYELCPDGSMVLAAEDSYGGDYCKEPLLEYGGAGLVSTAADYLRFAQMLLNGGELDGTRLLNPSSTKQMMSNQLGPEFGKRPLADLGLPWMDKEGLGFGFGGLIVTDISKADSVGSTGEYSWNGWATTDFWIDSKESLIGIVFTQVIPNGFPIDTRACMRQIVYKSLLRELR